VQAILKRLFTFLEDNMITNKMIQSAMDRNSSTSLRGIVSLALLNQLSARIARREGRMRHRATDRWAKQDETQLPPAA
jgi:hypothetical protein